MKNAIVFGATSGIGKELALLLAEKNYRVSVTGRRSELLEKLVCNYPDQLIPYCFDVSDIKVTQEYIHEIISAMGNIDLVVYCCGTGDLNEALDYFTEKRAIDVNVNGFTFVTDYFFNYFKTQNSGHLVNISSIAGIRGNALAPAYNASKAYQINYLEGLRQRKNKYNLKFYITDIRPGFVDTAMAKGDGLFWVAPVSKAAEQIFNAIKKYKKVVYISKRWRLIGGLLKILPSLIYDRM